MSCWHQSNINPLGLNTTIIRSVEVAFLVLLSNLYPLCVILGCPLYHILLRCLPTFSHNPLASSLISQPPGDRGLSGASFHIRERERNGEKDERERKTLTNKTCLATLEWALERGYPPYHHHHPKS